MEGLLVLGWLFVAVVFPLVLIAFSYTVYVSGDKPVEIIAKLICGLCVYVGFTLITGFLAGMMIFIGAHTDPPGNALDTKGEIVGAGILLFYAGAGWLSSSFIYGHLIGFRRSATGEE